MRSLWTLLQEILSINILQYAYLDFVGNLLTYPKYELLVMFTLLRS